MPRKKKSNDAVEGVQVERPALPAGVRDQLVTGPMTPDAFNAMFRELKKGLIEKALGAELTHHPKARSSGWRCSTTCATAASRTC